jgi:hypothetical protein
MELTIDTRRTRHFMSRQSAGCDSFMVSGGDQLYAGKPLSGRVRDELLKAVRPVRGRQDQQACKITT